MTFFKKWVLHQLNLYLFKSKYCWLTRKQSNLYLFKSKYCCSTKNKEVYECTSIPDHLSLFLVAFSGAEHPQGLLQGFSCCGYHSWFQQLLTMMQCESMDWIHPFYNSIDTTINQMTQGNNDVTRNMNIKIKWVDWFMTLFITMISYKNITISYYYYPLTA